MKRLFVIALLLVGCSQQPVVSPPAADQESPVMVTGTTGLDVEIHEIMSQHGIPCIVANTYHGVSISCDWEKGVH